MASKKTPSAKKLSPAEWEKAWQKHWKNAQLNYELPATDDKSTNAEHKFLTQRRTAKKEKARLSRITKEFEMGFKKLGHLGPAVKNNAAGTAGRSKAHGAKTGQD